MIVQEMNQRWKECGFMTTPYDSNGDYKRIYNAAIGVSDSLFNS